MYHVGSADQLEGAPEVVHLHANTLSQRIVVIEGESLTWAADTCDVVYAEWRRLGTHPLGSR